MRHGIADAVNQLPLVFNNYNTDMDTYPTTIAEMLVSFTRIDSGNIHALGADAWFSWACPMWARPRGFEMVTLCGAGWRSLAELLDAYFRNFTGPVSAGELTL